MDNLYGLAEPQWLEVRILSIEPVGCIAEYLPQNAVKDSASGFVISWLDSAKQLPAYDEYLLPLSQSIGSYDLVTSGELEIICSPGLDKLQ